MLTTAAGRERGVLVGRLSPGFVVPVLLVFVIRHGIASGLIKPIRAGDHSTIGPLSYAPGQLQFIVFRKRCLTVCDRTRCCGCQSVAHRAAC
jgi:hypothetical protein